MIIRKSLIALGFIGLLPACATAGAANPPAMPAGVELVGADGAALGRVEVAHGPAGVLLRIRAEGLPPGRHGLHLHAVGRCEGPGFQSAGGHINDGGAPRPHGLLNPEGPDFGDLPNLTVAADGGVDAEVFSGLVRYAEGHGAPALADGDGAALVVHANPDDHLSQPIGGAGDRIACAVLAPPRD